MTNPADIAAFLKRIEQNDLPIYVPPGLRFQHDPTVFHQWFPVDQSLPDKTSSDIGQFLKGKQPIFVDYYPPQRVVADEGTAHRETLLQEEGFSVYYLQMN